MSDDDTVVQSYIRTLARRGWCRQLPLVGQLDGDRSANNVSPAVTCVACRLGGARNGAGRDACFVRGSGRSGIGDVGATGSVSDNWWLTRGPDLGRRLGHSATAAHARTFQIGWGLN
jgi:hypothetical protein